MMAALQKDVTLVKTRDHHYLYKEWSSTDLFDVIKCEAT